MEYIFCSSIYDMNSYDELVSKSKVTLSLADHNLNMNIILGIDESLGKTIPLINNVQIPSYPNYPKIIFYRQRWSHINNAYDINCGFINLPIIKHITRAVTTFSELKHFVVSTKDEKKTVITYDIRLGIVIAIFVLKYLYSKINTCVILPDIPTEVLEASSCGNITLKNRLWANLKLWFIKRFDSYVFITEHMKEIVDVSSKHFVVLEGIYNNNQPPLKLPTTEKKIIFYSGQLNPAYGIDNLLNAAIELHKTDSNYELWICGSGKLADKIYKLAESNVGIRFFGYVNGERVRELQSEATVLVNPRQNVAGLTRYSFPSKTMEYLASGRPVIGYKLDGIPEEYDEFINYVESNTVDALIVKIKEICSKSQEERFAIGLKSRNFILEKKNPKVQCSKIIKVLDNI